MEDKKNVRSEQNTDAENGLNTENKSNQIGGLRFKNNNGNLARGFGSQNSNFGENNSSQTNNFQFKKNNGNFSENPDNQNNNSIENIIRQFKRDSSGIVVEYRKRAEYIKPSVKRKLKSINARRKKGKFRVFQKSY
ncbi:hypothetical protein FACS189465_3490 [Clostridia bacterium]|nr:hypothetical protein FACS189465_3490 [Clostridia bacterium]